MAKRKKSVSLVLSSGGARGLAHVGVIEWLIANGYEIRAIAGSSMGALVGGIYAAGKLEAYRHWVCALERSDVLRLLDPTLGWTGIFKGRRVIEKLRELIGEHRIEDLPVSFTAVATDIETQKEVWISKGPLFDAIRASIAVPLIFTPHKVNGRMLLDGGLVNPLPFAPTLHDTTDLTIVVNVNASPDRSGLRGGPPGEPDSPDRAGDADAPVAAKSGGNNYSERIKAFVNDLQERFMPPSSEEQDWDYFDIITRSIETMQNTISRMKLAAYTPDVTIEISRQSARAFEFHRAAELIDLGHKAAADALRSGRATASG